MSSPEPGNQTRASAYPPTGSAYPSGVDPPHGVPVPPLQTTAPVEESDSCRSREPSLSQALDGTSVTLLTWASLPTAHLLVSTVVALNSSSKASVQLPGTPTGVGLPWVPDPGSVHRWFLPPLQAQISSCVPGVALQAGSSRHLLDCALTSVPSIGVHRWLAPPSHLPRPARLPIAVTSRHLPLMVMVPAELTVQFWATSSALQSAICTGTSPAPE